MDVIDARQAFYRRNEHMLDAVLSACEPNQQAAIILLPLLFQINHRLLPGYNGADTPAGIYGYKPDKELITQARQMNSRFRYQQDTVLKNTVIDAIYLQANTMDAELTLWLVHIPTLRADQCSELNDKLQRVIGWLNSRDIHCSGRLVTAEQLTDTGHQDIAGSEASCSLFLDQFYLEACLLAGKYPLWWLLPPQKEAEYAHWAEQLRRARYVNNDEYLDLGSIAGVSQHDVVGRAIQQLQAVYEDPHRCWLELLLLVARASAWPAIDGLGWRLKTRLHEGDDADTRPVNIFAMMIGDALKQLHAEDYRSISAMFAPLSRLAQGGVQQLLVYLGQSLAPSRVEHQPDRMDVVDFLSLSRSLFEQIRQCFDHLVTRYNPHWSDDEQQQPLNALIDHMRAYLSDSEPRVAVYNTRNRAEFVIGRMLLRNQENGQSDDQDDGQSNDKGYSPWSLVIEMDEGQQRVIDGFDNLLSLITWAWLNRVVDQSTQISLDCPSRMIRQIEARHVLEVLIQQLDPRHLMRLPAQVFEHASTPIRSLLFTNLMASEYYRQRMESGALTDALHYEASDDLVVNCEQLIINSWGDVECRQYTGNQGVLQCLCDWTHHVPMQPGNRPHGIYCFGYAAGISTFWAQRIEQVYNELVEFFYQRDHADGRFIVRMGPEYFRLEATDGSLHVRSVGRQDALYDFLEQPNAQYRAVGLERYALIETPLRAIFERNKENVVQVFYQLLNRRCYTWVLDEKGSLWQDQQSGFDRSSYVAHWLYLMRNIRNRLKRINYQNREPPAIEIQHINANQLGGLDFYPLGAEAVNTERSFFDVQVSVQGDEIGDRLSLVCDGREFSYQQYQGRAMAECVQYIYARITGEGRKPVYVTDVDVPLRHFGVQERDAIQVSHFLRYKRNIERRMNQLVDG